MQSEILKINKKYKINLLKHRADFYRDRIWEKERLDSMHKHLNKHDVMYYIGAEQGEMPALCQMWGTQVYLFEPNYSAWRSIYETWKINKLDRPKGLFAMFVGQETELEPKNPDKDFVGYKGWELETDVNSKFNNWPKHAQFDLTEESKFSELHNEPDGLPIVCIDDVAAHAERGPTAMSIDVEGSEFEVLKGAENTLLTYKPKIWLSIHPTFLKDYWKTTENQVLKYLVDIGYDYTLLADEHEKHYFLEIK